MAGVKLKADEIAVLVGRLLEEEPGFFVERRSGGQCFFSRGELGRETDVPRLFAVAAGGGLLLRLPEETRVGVVDRGVGEPNTVLPKWVLDPPQIPSATPGQNGPRETDPRIHGDPVEWVWIPVEDTESFERRRPHVLEALAFSRHLLEQDEGPERQQ